VKIESTGGLKIDTTDANSSRVQIWNTAVLRSYEARAVRLVLDDTELSMLYTTIYDNDRTSADVGGLYLDTDGSNTDLRISRSVFWDNGRSRVRGNRSDIGAYEGPID
jgi:hypothetical protein